MRRVEPIATDDEAYEAYKEEMRKEDENRRAHPRPTKQYEHPIGPQRPPSFREKVESKAHDIKENVKELPGKAYERVKHEIGEIKRKHKENVEYEEEIERQERKVKSSPDYIKKKLEHGMYLEEMRAKRQGTAPRRSSVNTKSAVVSMGGYRSAYSGKPTNSYGGFRGSYMPAYTGQMWGSAPRHVVRQPVVNQPTRPTMKHETSKVHVFGMGEMPKIGNFTSSTPKVGGGGKRFETPMIGSGLLGSLPKIGKSITHKGRVRSMSHKTHSTHIGYVPQLKIGEVPKIGFGLKKRGMKK